MDPAYLLSTAQTAVDGAMLFGPHCSWAAAGLSIAAPLAWQLTTVGQTTDGLFLSNDNTPYNKGQIISNWIHEYDNDFPVC